MKKFSKRQQTLLVCALEGLYSYLSEQYDISWCNHVQCIIFGDLVEILQAEDKKNIAWFAKINLMERKIYLNIRRIVCDNIYTKRFIYLNYIEPTTALVLDF